MHQGSTQLPLGQSRSSFNSFNLGSPPGGSKFQKTVVNTRGSVCRPFHVRFVPQQRRFFANFTMEKDIFPPHPRFPLNDSAPATSVAVSSIIGVKQPNSIELQRLKNDEERAILCSLYITMGVGLSATNKLWLSTRQQSYNEHLPD